MSIQTPHRASQLVPDSAPFPPEQRAWLNGYFGAILAISATVPVGLSPEQMAQFMPPVADAKPKGPLDDGDDGQTPWKDPAMAIEARMTAAKPRVLRRRMMAAMAQQDCGQCGYNCEDYANNIFMQAEPRLNLCVPGGKTTARMLKTLVEEMGGGVLDPETKAAKEAAAPKPAAKAPDGPGRSRERPVEAHFISRRRLNANTSEKTTNHVEIDLTACGLDYEVGDSLGIFAKNDPALVDQILAQIGAPADFPIAGKTLRDTLIEDMSLAPAPDQLFELISYMVGGPRKAKARALAKGQDPDGDAATLDVLAALEKFSGLRPDPEGLIEMLQPLQPRLYSISSSPKDRPGRVALTVDTVRYQVAKRRRAGLASAYLDQQVTPGEPLKVYVQKAHGFALPADPSTPIIMVGPGTGVAPFRAFLQERRAIKAAGRAWLFFGHQRESSDFFYADELATLQAAGTLTKLSLAWSRDGDQKVYVQDRMREAGAELFAWLEAGAHFYICGDAKRMARDVEAALVAIAEAHGQMDAAAALAFVARLKADGRYQADVY